MNYEPDKGLSPFNDFFVYTALVTQTGANAPVSTILDNTFAGVPAWARTGVGVYTLTLAQAFTTSKTKVSFDVGGSDLAASGTVVVTYEFTSITVITFKSWVVTAGAFANGGAEWETVTPWGLEIRVYP